MVADKYITPYISGIRRELPTQWCWNGLCSMHMDEVVSRWRRRKKIIIKKDIVNSTFSLFYLHTNPQVCHICSEWNLPNSFLEIMRQILQEYVFRVWSYTFLNECCRAFEKNYISVKLYFLGNCWRKVCIPWHYWNEKRMDYITWWCKNCLCGVWLVEVVKTWRRINENKNECVHQFWTYFTCVCQL